MGLKEGISTYLEDNSPCEFCELAGEFKTIRLSHLLKVLIEMREEGSVIFDGVFYELRK